MHFTITFSFLLATLLIALSPVEALPVKRSAGKVTLPLKRVKQPSHDLHPRILFQQHINRSYRRFARMTGRVEPSDAELRSNIEERMNLLLTNVTNMGYSHQANVRVASGTRNAETPTNQTAHLIPRSTTILANHSLGLDIVASDQGYLATIQIGTPPRDYNVLIAGLNSSGHRFGEAKIEIVPSSPPNTPYAGVMGLERHILSAKPTRSPVEAVEALASNYLIQEPITSYKISRFSDGENDGEITFGGMDDTKFATNTLVTVENVNTQGYWEASMDTIFVNGADLGLQGRTAIFDTGVSFLLLPPQDVVSIHQLIDGAQADASGTFTIPCNTTASVALSFGGSQFTIDSRDLVIAEGTEYQTCRSNIVGNQFGNGTEWLVGDAFLKNAYLSTNMNTNQISLAKLV